MDGLNWDFMRLQTFENNEQYNIFEEYVKNFEKYEKKINQKMVKNDTHQYAWIQFNFLNCIPLNILMNAILNKQLEVQKIQIKNISIAILEHFIKLKKKSFFHGNIQPQNIIIELNENEINIYFTNYTFQERLNDEKIIKEVIIDLLKLIEQNDFMQSQCNDLKGKKIQDLLLYIKEINIQTQGWTIQTQGWKNKIKNFISWGGNKEIKMLSDSFTKDYPELKSEINQQIKSFLQKEGQQNCDSVCKQNEQISQNTKEVTDSHNQDQQENNDKETQQRKEKEQDQLNRISQIQKEFLKKFIKLDLLQFVEKVTADLSNQKQQQNKQEDEQPQQSNQAKKIDMKEVIKFIIDKHYVNATRTFEIIIEYFNDIQQTVNKWRMISDEHYNNYKFNLDELQFPDLVEQHFNEFLIQTYKNQTFFEELQKTFNEKRQKQKDLINQQLSEKYDQWISYKILDLISSLI